MFYILNVVDRKFWVYDSYDRKVVRAGSEKEARRLANECVGDEGKIWENEKFVSCDSIKSSGESDIICMSFNAG